MSEVKLWDCPDCGFAFDAIHKSEQADEEYHCPCCNEQRLAAQLAEARADQRRLEWCAKWGASFNWEDGKCAIHYLREDADGRPHWVETSCHNDWRDSVDDGMAGGGDWR